MTMNHEHALLGNAINTPRLLPTICGELVTDDFSTLDLRIIFTAVKHLWESEQKVDLATVAAELEKRGELEKVGGYDLLFDIVQFPITDANTDAYIERMHESRARRLFNRGMSEAVEASENGQDGFTSIAQATMDKVNSIGSSKSIMASDVLPIALNRLGDTTRGLSTGFTVIDIVTGGFHKNNLIIIAARTGQGKTAMACNLAANMCRSGNTVAFFTLEMGAEEVIERMLLSEAQVDKYDAMRSEQERRKVIDIQDRVAKWNLYINDRASMSVGQVTSTSHKIKQQAGRLDCVFVDYLQLMKTRDGKRESRTELLGEVSRSLKILAKELQCPVVALSQLNRSCEGRRPTIADLRESGAIEQDADMVILIHRENDAAKESTVIVGKNRSGRTGDVPMVWEAKHTRFYEPAFKSVSVPKGVFND